MGGLRDRHPGRRGRRRHDADRHAAQQHPADHHHRPPGGQARRRPRPDPHRRRLLGRRRTRQRQGSAPPPRGRGLRLQVLPAALRRRGVPPARPGGTGGGDARDRPVRRAADRPRRGLPAHRGRPAALRPRIRRLPRLPPPRRRERRGRGADRPRPPPGLPGARPAPVLRRGPAPDRGRPPRRRTADGRDLPALPDPHRRGGPRRRDPVQVLPADPRGGQPGGPVAGPARRHPRLRRLRPLALDRRPQAPRHRRLRRRLGRDLLPAARPARDLDRGPPAWRHARRRGRLDGAGPGTPRRAHHQGRRRARPRRRLRRPGSRRELHRGPGGAPPPQPGHRLRGPHPPGVVRSTWLRGERIADHGTPAHPSGRLITRENA